MFDLVLNGGTIADGTGAALYRGNVCVKDGKIAAITQEPVTDARQVLDVTGLVVAPGFIDVHTHSDSSYRSKTPLESHLAQGVTTEITGNCGTSSFPGTPAKKEILDEYLISKRGCGCLMSVSDYAEDINNHHPLVNYGALVGHGTLRLAVMGFVNREPDESEMKQMEELLDQEMSRGAFGMSLGLIYPPSAFSAKEELIALAKVIAKYDGILAVHMRNEGPRLFEAVDEVIEIAEKSGVHLQISHLKLMGKPQWGKSDLLLEKLLQAKARALNITCDQYPFLASSTSMNALVPHWAHEGGKEQMVARIEAREGDICEKIGLEMANRGGPDTVLVVSCGKEHRQWQGKFVSQLAEEFGLDPVETVRKVLLETKCSTSCIYFSVNEGDMLNIMSQKFICVASDGSDSTLDPEATQTNRHPRNYATFSQFFQTVREHKLMPVEDAVYKMTGLPAQILGLKDRGILREGMVADIAVFDPEKFGSRSTFLASCARPVGMYHVVVNGQLTIQDGVLTKARAGKALLK